MKSLRLALIASTAALIAACASTPKAPPAPAVTNVAGVWMINTETQMGPMDTKLTVQQTGKDLKGVMESPMGNVDVTGTVDGKEFKFGFDFDAQGTALRIDYVGMLEGDNNAMKGKASFGSFGEGTFTAKKNP
jgi:hypothetical protein